MQVSHRVVGFIGLGLVILVGPSVYFTWENSRKQAVKDLTAEARRLIDEGNPEAAQPILAELIKAEPDSAEAAFLVAKGALRLGMLDQGVAGLDRALALGFDRDFVDRERALLYVSLGRHEEAEPILRRLGLQSTLENPDLEVDQALVRCLLETFQIRDARIAVDDWISHDPENPDPYYWRAEIETRSDVSASDLISDYEEALRLDPAHRNAKHGLADKLLAIHKYESARDLFESLLDQNPEDLVAMIGLGRALAGLGSESSAADWFQRAATLDPANPEPLIQVSKIEFRQGRLESALKRLDRAVELAPFEAEAHYQRNLVLTRLGRTSEAEEARERAVVLQEDQNQITDLMERLYGRPHDLRLQLEAARWFFRNGRPEEGIRWAKKIVSDSPEHPEANRLLAQHYREIGEDGLANFHRLQAGKD